MKTLYFATISSVQIYSPTELVYLTAAFCIHTATDQADTQASQSHHFGVLSSFLVGRSAENKCIAPALNSNPRLDSTSCQTYGIKNSSW